MEAALIISLIVNVVLIVSSYTIVIDYDKALRENNEAWSKYCDELNNKWYEKCMNIINKTNKEE